ncbi:MAG: type II toxin-antitoxin system death-on-curing family toxin [Solirubrobacteraceae bacterium]
MIFLDVEGLLHVAVRALGSPPAIRDLGLLESALSRPRATVFGEDAYPGIHDKAAALLHSLARNHALVDGNKRLALAGILAFYGMNGLRLTLSNDEAYELVMSVATAEMDDVPSIASALQRGSAPRAQTREEPGDS